MVIIASHSGNYYETYFCPPRSDGFQQGVVQGQEKDIPLNAEGMRQVERAATQLTQPIDRIISSPLKRAAQTADIINERLQKPIESQERPERDQVRKSCGQTWPEIEAETGDPRVHEKDQRHNVRLSPLRRRVGAGSKKESGSVLLTTSKRIMRTRPSW